MRACGERLAGFRQGKRQRDGACCSCGAGPYSCSRSAPAAVLAVVFAVMRNRKRSHSRFKAAQMMQALLLALLAITVLPHALGQAALPKLPFTVPQSFGPSLRLSSSTASTHVVTALVVRAGAQGTLSARSERAPGARVRTTQARRAGTPAAPGDGRTGSSRSGQKRLLARLWNSRALDAGMAVRDGQDAVPGCGQKRATP